jgi:hypothetical protein
MTVKDRVPGTIKYMGPLTFTPGMWVGVELDYPIGKHSGKGYFSCRSNHGMFYLPQALMPFQAQPPPQPSAPSAPPPQAVSTTVQVGCMVETVDGLSGVCRFVGITSFAPGQWCGLELATPTGLNDGSVQGRRYFACTPRHGLFVPISDVKLQRPEEAVTEVKTSLARVDSHYGDKQKEKEVKRLKVLFPSMGEEFLEACLIACDMNFDETVHYLLKTKEEEDEAEEEEARGVEEAQGAQGVQGATATQGGVPPPLPPRRVMPAYDPYVPPTAPAAAATGTAAGTAAAKQGQGHPKGYSPYVAPGHPPKPLPPTPVLVPEEVTVTDDLTPMHEEGEENEKEEDVKQSRRARVAGKVHNIRLGFKNVLKRPGKSAAVASEDTVPATGVPKAESHYY